MQAILLGKVILKQMVYTIIQYFSQCARLSDENNTAPTTSDYRLNPQLSYYGTKTRVK